MMRFAVLVVVVGISGVCFAGEGIENLPKPHYQAQDSDPSWLKYAAQFHGHLGPMATFGARMGMAALKAVDAKGYFDIEITCEGPFVKPPESCFLDGLQISTGATLGKRNLDWVKADKIVVRIKNTKSGKTAEVRPTEAFLAMLEKHAADGKDREQSRNHHHSGDLSRKIAAMSEKEIVAIGNISTNSGK